MSTRTDSFLIWGHGLQYTAEIMTILRSYFPIIYIHTLHIDDMPSFVDRVYSNQFEDFPIEHIREKTKYLLQTPQDVVFILVRNHHVEEYETGSGRFYKVRCRYNQQAKDKIRAQFNPPTGPHDHILHGTDSEGEVKHMMELMGIKKKLSFFTRNEGTPFPYHIDKEPYSETSVPLKSLWGNILGMGMVPLIKTPQYQYAIGNKQPYIDYFYKYFGKGLHEDHFPEKFDDMLTWENLDPVLVRKRGLIVDGGKRACIRLSRGEININAYLIRSKIWK